MVNQTRLDNFEECSGEKGILTLITNQRIIRQAYLNNRPIAAQIDTCSLVSVVESGNPKLNRILEVGKKIKMRPLHWEKEWWEESQENTLVSEPKMRFKPRTLVDTSKKDTRKEAEDSEGLDPGTVCTSDDPRRGGKTKHTNVKVTEAGPSKHMAKDDLSRSKEVGEVNPANQMMRPTKPDMAKNITKYKTRLRKGSRIS